MANEFKVRKSLVVNGSGSVLFDVQGSQGQLFSITDSLSGSLFAVKDISGMPVMEAFSDNTVRMGQFGQKALFVSQSRVGIGKEAALTATLDVSGSATVTGSLSVSGSILQNGGGVALQDGTILYHSVKWFTPSSTVSTSGNTVTSVGTQFTSAMVGAKLTVSGESRLIATYTSNTQVVVDSAYSQNYSAITASNWSVFSRAIHIDSSGNRSHYNTTGILQQSNNYFPTTLSTVQFNSNANMSAFGDFGLATYASGAVTWGSGTTANTSQTARDLGIRRYASGSLEIYDGATADGTLTNRRDLLVRNITGSNATFSGSLVVSGSLTLTSASLAVSGSLSINGINITATGGFQQTFAAATTWVVTHNLNTLYPVITVYNGSGQVIIPSSITATDVNTTTVTFNIAVAGTVNIISGQLQQNIAVSNPTAVALSTVLGG